MAKNRNPQAVQPPKPTPEQLKKSPEANATNSHAKGVPQPDPRIRYESISRAAYARAEKRGFTPGQELDDWVQAEAEYDSSQKDKSEKH